MQARVWQMSHLAVVAGVLVFVLGGTAFAQSNPFIGTWNVNFAKSKYNPGPPPKSETRVAELWETDGLKFTATGVGADGAPFTQGASVHYDGKDYKYTGSPAFDTIAVKRVNANTIAYTTKKGGKVVVTGTFVVSKNGKMATDTSTMMNAKGQKVRNVDVWDKQ
jgi:hypothetical protein